MAAEENEPENEALQKAIAKVLRDTRIRAGLTQAQLSEVTGKTKQAISCYENASYFPTFPVVFSIAIACGTSLASIFEEVSREIGMGHTVGQLELVALQTEFEISHRTLTDAGVPANPIDGGETPISINDRIKFLAQREDRALIRAKTDLYREIVAMGHLVLSMAGAPYETIPGTPPPSLGERIRSLLMRNWKPNKGPLKTKEVRTALEAEDLAYLQREVEGTNELLERLGQNTGSVSERIVALTEWRDEN